MTRLILASLLFMQVGCAEFITYTLVSAGTLTGQIAHDMYNEHLEDKEKEAKKHEQ